MECPIADWRKFSVLKIGVKDVNNQIVGICKFLAHIICAEKHGSLFIFVPLQEKHRWNQ